MPRFTLAEYQQSSLPLDELIVGRLGYVHELFLDFDYDVVDDLPCDRRDLVIVADGSQPKGRIEQLSQHDGRVVIAFAPSDAAFDIEVLPDRHSLPANIVAAFVSNNQLRDSRVTNVPLGVRLENAPHYEAVKSQPVRPRDRLLYGNFSVSSQLLPGAYGEAHVRHQLVERFGDVPWAELDVATGARLSVADQLRYYETMVRHKFILSPEGIGTDTYRHWESLYLGTIPIVRRSPTMSCFTDLPILFTEDYSEIDEVYLTEQWDRFGRIRFEVEKLTAAFYRQRFAEAIALLDKPRFLCWGFRGGADESFLQRVQGRVVSQGD